MQPTETTADDVFAIEVRPGKLEDLAFISASWLKGVFKGSYWAKRISHDIFYAHHRDIVSAILQRANAYVAHPQGDPDTIIGYLVVESHQDRPLVQWVYTRATWRRIGVAKTLFNEAGVNPAECTFSTWSYDCDWIVKKLPTLTFNPYLMR